MHGETVKFTNALGVFNLTTASDCITDINKFRTCAFRYFPFIPTKYKTDSKTYQI